MRIGIGRAGSVTPRLWGFSGDHRLLRLEGELPKAGHGCAEAERDVRGVGH
jgi:hypothetical protein